MISCLYFGCWNRPGHYLVDPGGNSVHRELHNGEYYGGEQRIHLDGTLAPRKRQYTGELCWQGMGTTSEERYRIGYGSSEYPQGQFLRHVLDTGWTAIQWWDRCQGDRRGACNSTVLLKGEHTTDEMIEALSTCFPHVLANLKRAGVELIEVVKPTEDPT